MWDGGASLVLKFCSSFRMLGKIFPVGLVSTAASALLLSLSGLIRSDVDVVGPAQCCTAQIYEDEKAVSRLAGV